MNSPTLTSHEGGEPAASLFLQTAVRGQLVIVGGLVASGDPIAVIIRNEAGTIFRCAIVGGARARELARNLFLDVHVEGLAEWSFGLPAKPAMKSLLIHSFKRI